MAQKPNIPKGTRDFTPVEMVKRNYIFDTIQSVFEVYGYKPIETPAMESLSTLLGKYGDEGDKLLFKVLNSGDFTTKVPEGMLQQASSGELTKFISEKGLRYDLTVPFARFVVQHRNELTFPFKRYQVQPVWRADKPQRGRYREFFQCDVDVIGSKSLLNEVELVQIIKEVFARLKISATVKLNNRKVLYGIAEYIGETEKFVALTVAIDKLEKIGIEKVKQELESQAFANEVIEKLEEILVFEGDTTSKLQFLGDKISKTETGRLGLEEISFVFSMLKELDIDAIAAFDLTLARGLNYYTGAIFEVVANDVKIGSICGGGRYDDLTGIFGMPDVSGVGVSFGADRIYDVLTELRLFPEEAAVTTKVFFVNFGDKEQRHCLKLAAELRTAGISVEVYPESAKMKKQMTYANNNNIPFVVMIGENEIEQGILTVKDMATGEQKQYKGTKQLVEALAI